MTQNQPWVYQGAQASPQQSGAVCPLCDGTNNRLVLQWRGVAFYLCPGCTHIFTSKLREFANPDRAGEVETLYGEQYLDGSNPLRPNYLEGFHRNYEHSLQRLRQLHSFVAPPGRLLEIGCNIGYFVKAAQEVGWTPVGVDISAAAIAVARERTQGISLEIGEPERIDFPPTSFNAVCCFHTLEHVTKPMNTLSRTHQLLVPGGFLHIEVPYTRRVIAKRGVTNYDVLKEQEHLSHFGPESLRYALVRSGFRVRKMQLVGGGYGLGILQPRGELVARTGVISDLLDQLRRAVFAARPAFLWNPGLRQACRQIYWHTLRQGGGIEAFAERV